MREAREAILKMDFEKARSLYRQLSERNPENTDYIIWIGRVSGWLTDYSSADAALDQALEREPRNADALIAKAYIRMYQRRYVDAAGLLQNSISPTARPEAYRRLAEVYAALGRTEQSAAARRTYVEKRLQELATGADP